MSIVFGCLFSDRAIFYSDSRSVEQKFGRTVAVSSDNEQKIFPVQLMDGPALVTVTGNNRFGYIRSRQKTMGDIVEDHRKGDFLSFLSGVCIDASQGLKSFGNGAKSTLIFFSSTNFQSYFVVDVWGGGYRVQCFTRNDSVVVYSGAQYAVDLIRTFWSPETDRNLSELDMERWLQRIINLDGISPFLRGRRYDVISPLGGALQKLTMTGEGWSFDSINGNIDFN